MDRRHELANAMMSFRSSPLSSSLAPTNGYWSRLKSRLPSWRATRNSWAVSNRLQAALRPLVSPLFGGLLYGHVADFLHPVLGYQTQAAIRVNFHGSRQILRMHRDSEYGQTEGHVNLWLPVTKVGGTNIMYLETNVGARHPHLAQPGAEDALTGDERRPSCRAALLAVGIREPHPLVGDPIDIRGAIPHQTAAVTAEVRDPDVITPDDEDVRLFHLSHIDPPPRGRTRHA